MDSIDRAEMCVRIRTPLQEKSIFEFNDEPWYHRNRRCGQSHRIPALIELNNEIYSMRNELIRYLYPVAFDVTKYDVILHRFSLHADCKSAVLRLRKEGS